MSKEAIREAGGIFHKDGNIFFTNQTMLDNYVNSVSARQTKILEIMSAVEDI